MLKFLSAGNPYVFILFLGFAVGLAWIAPDAAASGGWFRPEITTKAAIFIIFILQGLSLPIDEIKNGLLQYRTHILIQSFIFLFIPVLVWSCMLFAGGIFAFDLRMGFLFLAAVPTTISSSVVYTTQAGGSTTIALFNASASNVLGIFLVPLWVSWQMGQSVALPPVGGMIMKIIWVVLLPLILGQVLRKWAREWADRNHKGLSNFSMGLILFIVYLTFSNSFKSDSWKNLGRDELSIAFAAVLILMLMVMAFGGLFFKMGGLKREDGIAFFFSATQKALSTGIPMAHALFDLTRLDIALILVPLMVYHPVQLLVGGFIVGKFARGGQGIRKEIKRGQTRT
ncbi:MAG TPA: bile acid:sodium symporter family protein [Desulfobacteria bacterium]|nr:bile acid:sodium symporter family protein [Desulfobacteria bacterium]